MKKPEIILVGGGGHCKSCIDVIEAQNIYSIKGIVDLQEEKGKSVLGYDIFANDDDLTQLAQQKNNFLITLGHLGNSNRRNELFKIIMINGGNLPVIIAPSALISKHAKIGAGTIIMHQSIVNVDSEIGQNCIVNNKALIEHDVSIGDDCHISTGVNVNGHCTIFNNVFLGSGTTLKHGISISENVIIGAGSLVTKSVRKSGIYFGNPIKRIRS